MKAEVLESRFHRKVAVRGPNECWSWTASKKQDGYGQIRMGNRMVLAHRVAWMLANGPIPESISVCHTCDNRACVNPSHLWLGTHRQNILDRHEKGRSKGGSQRGEAHPKSKLTNKDVAAIRQSGLTSIALGKMYGVHPVYIRHLRRGVYR